MESQRELVAAAEALKTWVISQRAARTTESQPGRPAPFLPAEVAAAAPSVWSAATSPIVFPSMPVPATPGPVPPSLGEPQPTLPLGASEGLAEGVAKILPQVVPDLAGVGRLALKVAAGIVLLAAVGGAAM